MLTYGVLTMLGPGDQSEGGRVPALTVLPGVCEETGMWSGGSYISFALLFCKFN